MPDAAFFVEQGYEVKAREYGTPQYREMFTILDGDHFPMYEIRRNPYSIKANGGVFDARACHIRLSNRQCYHSVVATDALFASAFSLTLTLSLTIAGAVRFHCAALPFLRSAMEMYTPSVYTLACWFSPLGW